MEYTGRWHSTSSPVDTEEYYRRPKLGGQSTATGRHPGDLLAYIDLQQAQLHTIRSDGQRDTIIPQPLLKAGITPASVWDTATGENILNSLTWSPDDTMLAFVADPTGTGLTNLSVYSQNSGTIQTVQLPMQAAFLIPSGRPMAYG